ncbi:MAG: phenylalanine--tRNA ligase subunit alpha [Candidatus Nanohaloarchaea archaeon]
MELTTQAKRLLERLRTSSATVSDLEAEGMDQSMVNRALLELKDQGLAEVETQEEVARKVTEKGEKVMEKGSPEYRLVEKLKEEEPIKAGETGLPDVALGKAQQKGWIEIEDGEVLLDEDANPDDEVRLRLETEDFSEELEERGLVETEIEVEKHLQLTEKGRDLDLEDVEEDFDVEARTKTPRTGRKHFYRGIMDHARQVWLEMGFREIEGDYVVPSLINFDALYTPQDHPARELHDTFFMENPERASLAQYGNKVGKIRDVHQDGGSTGSSGWDYDWNRSEAEKNVLRTHTTAATIRRIHEIDVNQEDLPKKFFTLGRNFRNETVDRHHLAEFYQTDGIVVGEDLSFRNLKGYISEFFERMGYDEFKLIPSYYPYTEMSVEVQVYDDESQEWIGLGGAGMFRPEVVEPMLGFEANVLAWGLGIGRIAMKAAELDDIRELYRNDLETLERTPVWRPDV